MPIAQFIKLAFQLAVKFPHFLRYVPMMIRIYPMMVKFMDDLVCAVKGQCPGAPTIAKDIVKGRVKYATKTKDLVDFVDALRGLMKK